MGAEEKRCFRSWNAFSTAGVQLACPAKPLVCAVNGAATELKSHKSPVDISKTQKTQNFFDCAGPRPVDHRFYLLGVHPHTALRHDAPQEGDLRNVKHTSRPSQTSGERGVFEEPGELVDVFNHGPGEDEDVIQVHKHELVNEITQHIINQCLEKRLGIC
jgi:hypothetical protein